MRIKYIIVSLSVFFVFLHTQAQTILNQPETFTRTVQDPNAVIMMPGFSVNGNLSNPFIARIGTLTEIPPASPNNSTAGASNPSGESTTLSGSLFHDTKGDIAVGSGGQLTYSLPIALPPGINSVAPQMNLTYTSGSGNGIAGYGWSLSGVTSIARAGKNIEKDNELKGIQLDYTDFYYFNGNRLLLKSGEYGKDGAEYITEKYSNLKIKSIGSITGESYQGPVSWEITFEDGSQAWYGTDPTSRTPVEYNITKWKDAQGNYITYNYTQSEKVAHISSVKWGGNETLSKVHFNELVFQYATRDSKEIAYSNGLSFIQQSILTNVQVNANGILFKKYDIAYKKDSNNTNYQYVDKITEYNSQNQAANPVVFNYQSSSNSNWSQRNFTDNDNERIVGDFDGDGTIDYLKYYNSYTECTQYEEYEEVVVDDDSGYYTETKTRCISSVPRNAGVNLFASFFNNTGQMQSVSEPVLSFTKDQFNSATAISFIDNNKQISAKQGILIRKEIPISGSLKKDLLLEIYALDNGVLKLKTSKILPASMYDNSMSDPNASYELDDGYEYQNVSVSTKITSAVELDMDGNGVSEIALLGTDYTRRTNRYSISSNGQVTNYDMITSETGLCIIADMNPEIPVEKSFSLNSSLYNQLKDGKKIGDFNGDGKTDIISIDYANPYIIEFYRDQNTLGFNYNYNVFSTSSSPSIKGLKDKAILGDFNGDGKTDLFIPMAEESKDWNMYISTGNSFIELAYPNFSYFRPNNSYVDSGRAYYYLRQYLAQDINQDGKSDFIEFSSHSRQNRHTSNNFSEFIVNAFENKGFDSTTAKYIFEKKNIDGHTESVSDYPFGNNVKQYKSYPFNYVDSGKNYSSGHAPFASIGTPDVIEPYSIMAGNFRISNSNSQIVVIKKGKMLNFSYAKVSAKINSIIQGGITTEIEYKELDPVVNPGFYASDKKEQYPYVELDRLSQSYGVSQLRQAGRKQDFKYRGFISNLQGRGMIGYRKTARSSWYANGFENSKIWSASEIDPLNNGVPIKEWSTRDENNLFPADVNENTAGLLSFKKTEYETTTLLSGVEALVTKSTLQKDFLMQVSTITTIEYDNYFLPKKSILNTNNGFGTKTTELTYAHNESGTGNSYYIGRMTTKEEIVTAYGDTKKSKQEFGFANNLVQTIKSYNNDYSGYVIDSFVHDGFGNVLEKETTNSVDGQTQKVKTVFDDKGRFVIKKIDNLGLEAIITNNDWGQVLTQTDPLGNTLTNTYDAWGKLLTSHDNLSGYVTYKYEKQDFNTTVTKYLPDGHIEATVTNAKGETTLTRTKAFNNNQYIEKAFTYDVLGRKTAESEPYLSSESPKWNNISYDESVFPPKATATAFNGKQIETLIEGRTTIITELNGYNRVTKKTNDALGNVIESEDKGGTIQFTYNAAGQNLTATYGTNVVKTTYDNWGRKASFNDPSNGVYSYIYHGFGQLKKETSPKGYKEYGYNNLGQLTTQTERSSDGTSTNKDITFTYDNKGRITSRQGVSNGKAYSSYITYDAQGRIIASGENSNNRNFLKKNVIYDDKGRVTSYEKGMYSAGAYTKAIIENVYSNWSGDLQQLKDKTSQKVLWQLDAVKANGQVLNAQLGATSIVNNYDNNNFLTAVNHSHQVSGQTLVTVLGLGYNFTAIKNELNQRTRTGFGIATENFVYDNNNRLLNWTNPKTGQMSNNVYDEKGRITENDQLGKVNFNNSAKIYQATSIEPNGNLPQHWPDAASILQKITYNENNDPIYLDGKKGDYAFEYGLDESRQVMHYGGDFDPVLAAQQAKFSKYYSEDGSYEVIRDNTTGQEKHILYIGGSPYESDIVLLKNFTETTAKFVFLHKDYLGTILAITSDTGEVLEQRHFDAWGILTHGEIKLIDRGYTSHEHLQDVGIIHMNGRLYDPLMRRFLNADENIQDPYNTQNYNKYGYVMNNPLMFNDPSGEVIFLGIAMALVVKAIIIGAAVALASYTVGLAITGNMWRWSVGGALKSMFWGGVSGAVTFGIGNLFSVAKGGVQTATALADGLGKTGTIFVGAACHAVAQGALSMMQGGKFLSGAAAGFLGHLGGSAWGASMKGLGFEQFANSTGGIVSFGALSGGVGAELTGGNFWQGAVTGGIVAGLNNAMHKMQVDENTVLAKRIAKEYGYDDWRGIKEFLDKNPFVLTHKGVEMGGVEALSSKNIEEVKSVGNRVLNYAGDEVISNIQEKIIEFFSPTASKIFSMAGTLLSTQTAHAPDTKANYIAGQNQRIAQCKSILIRHFFERPAIYQIPSMYNNQQSFQYHSSRFDRMNFNY